MSNKKGLLHHGKKERQKGEDINEYLARMAEIKLHIAVT